MRSGGEGGGGGGGDRADGGRGGLPRSARGSTFLAPVQRPAQEAVAALRGVAFDGGAFFATSGHGGIHWPSASPVPGRAGCAPAMAGAHGASIGLNPAATSTTPGSSAFIGGIGGGPIYLGLGQGGSAEQPCVDVRGSPETPGGSGENCQSASVLNSPPNICNTSSGQDEECDGGAEPADSYDGYGTHAAGLSGYHSEPDEDYDGEDEAELSKVPMPHDVPDNFEPQEFEIIPTSLGDCGCVSTNPGYKKRKIWPKGVTPPDCRVPRAMGAIEKAMRNSRHRTTTFIFEPVLGMVFDSRAEAYQFFNLYSWEVGFGVRFGSSARNRKNKYRTMQKIVCEKEPLRLKFWSQVSTDGNGSMAIHNRELHLQPLEAPRSPTQSWQLSLGPSFHLAPLGNFTTRGKIVPLSMSGHSSDETNLGAAAMWRAVAASSGEAKANQGDDYSNIVRPRSYKQWQARSHSPQGRAAAAAIGPGMEMLKDKVKEEYRVF